MQDFDKPSANMKKIVIYFHARRDFMPHTKACKKSCYSRVFAFCEYTSSAAPDNALEIDYKSPIAISEAHKKPISVNLALAQILGARPDECVLPNLDDGGTSSAYNFKGFVRAKLPPSFITWQQYMPTRDWPDRAWGMKLFGLKCSWADRHKYWFVSLAAPFLI